MSNYKGMGWEERKAEGDRIIAKLRADLAAEHGVSGHPKEPKLWALAWDYGHAYGASEIRSHYDELVELLSEPEECKKCGRSEP